MLEGIISTGNSVEHVPDTFIVTIWVNQYILFQQCSLLPSCHNPNVEYSHFIQTQMHPSRSPLAITLCLQQWASWDVLSTLVRLFLLSQATHRLPLAIWLVELSGALCSLAAVPRAETNHMGYIYIYNTFLFTYILIYRWQCIFNMHYVLYKINHKKANTIEHEYEAIIGI